MDIIHIDSTLLKGDSEQAQKLAEKYSSFKADRLDMYLEQARIFERFAINLPNNRESAISFYQKALGKCTDPEQKNWISRKITYLKNNKNNQTMSYVGGKLWAG